MLAYTDYQILVCCHMYPSLVFARFDYLNSKSNLALKESQLRYPRPFIHYPIRFERSLLIQFIIPKADVIADIIGIRATFKSEDMLLGYNDSLYRNAG
jgi:hypothetical protein